MEGVAPWIKLEKHISLYMLENSKVSVYHQFCIVADEQYKSHYKLFTDESQTLEPTKSTACAMYDPQLQRVITWKLHPDHSVIASELFALMKSLEYIESTENKSPDYVVFTDSQAAFVYGYIFW